MVFLKAVGLLYSWLFITHLAFEHLIDIWKQMCITVMLEPFICIAECLL